MKHTPQLRRGWVMMAREWMRLGDGVKTEVELP